MTRDIEDWDEFLAEDDEIEILEVVGMAEDAPGAPPAKDPPSEGEESEEVLLDFEDVVAASSATTPPTEEASVPALDLSPEFPQDPPAVEVTAPAAVGLPEMSRDELLDRMKRIQADFDNLEKRLHRERETHARQANKKLILDLLPMIDNFERALEADGDTDGSNLRHGVILIFRQMLDVLRRSGLQPIDAEGAEFDPTLHEAVESDKPGEACYRVVEVVQRGYMLHERLLRPALVKVRSVPPEEL